MGNKKEIEMKFYFAIYGFTVVLMLFVLALGKTKEQLRAMPQNEVSKNVLIFPAVVTFFIWCLRTLIHG